MSYIISKETQFELETMHGVNNTCPQIPLRSGHLYDKSSQTPDETLGEHRTRPWGGEVLYLLPCHRRRGF